MNKKHILQVCFLTFLQESSYNNHELFKWGGVFVLKNSELKTKDVIDINSGKRLGYISDVDIEIDKGQIKAFVIPAHQNRLYNFFLKKNDQIINWEEIKLIGEDVILVELVKESSLKRT